MVPRPIHELEYYEVTKTTNSISQQFAQLLSNLKDEVCLDFNHYVVVVCFLRLIMLFICSLCATESKTSICCEPLKRLILVEHSLRYALSYFNTWPLRLRARCLNYNLGLFCRCFFGGSISSMISFTGYIGLEIHSCFDLLRNICSYLYST